MRWGVRRRRAGGVPHHMRANAAHPLPSQPFRPKHPKSSQPISRLVEPPSNGLPLQTPPPLSKGAKGKFHLSLQKRPLKPPSACAVPDNREVVANRAGCTRVRGDICKGRQGRPAASGLGHLGVVDVR